MTYMPIAYTYDADTHCPGCAHLAGMDEVYPEGALDSEGNMPGVIMSWDDWCGWNGEPAIFTLACGTCGGVIDTCDHRPQHGSEPEPEPTPCECDQCREWSAEFDQLALDLGPDGAVAGLDFTGGAYTDRSV